MNMSGLERTLEVVSAHVDVASEFTDADVVSLLSRLDALWDEVGSPDPDSALEFECSTWVREVRACLLPRSRERIAQSLAATRGTRPVRLDRWADLDEAFVAERDASVAVAWNEAQIDALECCERFLGTQRVGQLRRAVNRLEAALGAARSRQASKMSIAAAPRERRRLGTALDFALEPDARAFFVQHVRTLLGGDPSTAEQLLSEERWTWPRSYYLRELGTVFAPFLQHVYDDARRAEEEQRAADERRRDEEARIAAREKTPATQDEALESASPGSSAQVPRPVEADVVEDPPSRPVRVLVPVDLPTGRKWLDPAMAAASEEALDWMGRHDGAREEQKRLKREYHALIGRPDMDD